MYFPIYFMIKALKAKYCSNEEIYRSQKKWFIKHFIKSKIFPLKFWEIYENAYINMQRADFEYFKTFEKEEVEQHYQNMLIFVNGIEKYINENNQININNLME